MIYNIPFLKVYSFLNFSFCFLLPGIAAEVPLISKHLTTGQNHDDSVEVWKSENGKDELLVFNPKKNIKDWVMFSIGTHGLVFGEKMDVGYGKPAPGFYYAYDFIRVAFSFKKLAGFGFGTSLMEGINSSAGLPDSIDEDEEEYWQTNSPSSFFPTYIYYALYGKIARTYFQKHEGAVSIRTIISPFVYLFAGGCLWGKKYPYANIGITAAWSPYHIGYVTMKCGAFFTPEFKAENGSLIYRDVSPYISLNIDMAVIRIKRTADSIILN